MTTATRVPSAADPDGDDRELEAAVTDSPMMVDSSRRLRSGVGALATLITVGESVGVGCSHSVTVLKEST